MEFSLRLCMEYEVPGLWRDVKLHCVGFILLPSNMINLIIIFSFIQNMIYYRTWSIQPYTSEILTCPGIVLNMRYKRSRNPANISYTLKKPHIKHILPEPLLSQLFIYTHHRNIMYILPHIWFVLTRCLLCFLLSFLKRVWWLPLVIY